MQRDHRINLAREHLHRLRPIAISLSFLDHQRRKARIPLKAILLLLQHPLQQIQTHRLEEIQLPLSHSLPIPSALASQLHLSRTPPIRPHPTPLPVLVPPHRGRPLSHPRARQHLHRFEPRREDSVDGDDSADYGGGDDHNKAAAKGVIK